MYSHDRCCSETLSYPWVFRVHLMYAVTGILQWAWVWLKCNLQELHMHGHDQADGTLGHKQDWNLVGLISCKAVETDLAMKHGMSEIFYRKGASRSLDIFETESDHLIYMYKRVLLVSPLCLLRCLMECGCFHISFLLCIVLSTEGSPGQGKNGMLVT